MAILQILSRTSTHLTPVQIHQRARRALPGLRATTVYRTLEQLARSGVVWSIHLENGHLAYELAGRKHHHLVCTVCGSEVELPVISLDPIYTQLESSSGYVMDRDHLTLRGVCPRCQRRRNKWST